MSNKVYVSYIDIEDYVKELCVYLKEHNIQPTGVYGIPRGGLFFAMLISYRLNIPMLLAPCDGCIVVDDIADSGRTLLHFTKNDTQFNKYFITTMYYHERSQVIPDFWYMNKGTDWIVFPYEEI